LRTSACSCAFKSENDLRKLVVWWLLLLPIAGFAASGDEFYQRLYQRGMAHFAAGEYAAAFTELRNAAFGFVEHVDKFETAQCYAIVAAHRLGRDSDARESLMRIVSAEKVQPHFRTVTLPADIRAEVESVAAAVLTNQECTLLGLSACQQSVVVPTPTKRPNVAVTAPREKQSTDVEPDADPKKTPPAPAPKPPAPVPQPVTPAPQPPAPQPVAPPKQQTPDPQPKVPTPVPTPQPAVKSVEASLADAQQAIDSGDVGKARSIYNALTGGSDLSHAASLRVGEGLYRAQDYRGAAKAFQRAGAIGKGEEQYHYYFAVALYETGRYADAKRELAASLPYITVTADVTRYRAKIEGAIE
jgi:tetratricopeptide (TPR) repeat protein